MNAGQIISLIVSIALFAYLVFALLRGEKL
jgi:K+-transporting ATPase KdpF subunit